MTQCTCVYCEVQRKNGATEYLAMIDSKFITNGPEMLTTDQSKATLFTAGHMRDNGGFGVHVVLQKT